MGSWFSSVENDNQTDAVNVSPNLEEEVNCKLITVGSHSAGKASLLRRYFEGNFSEHAIPCIGVEFHKKEIEIDAQKVKLTAWDSSGEERFHSINPAYFRGANAILIITSVTSVNPLEAVKLWYEKAKKYFPPNSRVYLIGTKIDLADERNASWEDMNNFAEGVNLPYFEVSAKENENVNELFLRIAHETCGRSYPPESYRAKSARK